MNTTQKLVNKTLRTFTLTELAVGANLKADLLARGWDGTAWIGVSKAEGRRNNDERQASKIEAVAETCRRGMSPEAAQEEMRSLHPRTNAGANPYAKAYANVYGDANVYAAANAYGDAYGDAYAYAYANAYANSDPNADAYAHSYANAYANATTYYADADAYARDKFLRAVADSVEAALRACGSPGIALLPLTPPTEPTATE